MGSVPLSQRIRYRLWSLPRSPREWDATLLSAGTYRRIGWFTTLNRGAPVDCVGAELPWFTYPAIYWLEGTLRGREHAFAYGAGHSTLWFSRHVAQITSVESDERWVRSLRHRLPANASVLHRMCSGDKLWAASGDPYVEALKGAVGGYDLIVIGGLARNSCITAATKSIRPSGLIILGNADHPAYRSACDMLRSREYQRLDLVGPAPGAVNFSCTSIFSTDLSSWLRDASPPPYRGDSMDEYRLLPPTWSRQLLARGGRV